MARLAMDLATSVEYRLRTARAIPPSGTPCAISGVPLSCAILSMARPCPHCGAQKTESVRHGFWYTLAKAFGYRLRKCSRCRRLRLLPRHGETHETAGVDDAGFQPGAADACPRCGSKDYRRSRRRWWERLIGRGPMARCRACRQRFPYPLLSGRVSG
jgi:hypothetical protein